MSAMARALGIARQHMGDNWEAARVALLVLYLNCPGEYFRRTAEIATEAQRAREAGCRTIHDLVERGVVEAPKRLRVKAAKAKADPQQMLPLGG